jgi:hypothetical protein
LVIISVLVLGEVLGEVLKLLSGFIVSWQMVHSKEGLWLGVVLSLVMKMLSFLSFLDSKVVTSSLQKEWLRAKTNKKWRTDAMLFSCF